MNANSVRPVAIASQAGLAVATPHPPVAPAPPALPQAAQMLRHQPQQQTTFVPVPTSLYHHHLQQPQLANSSRPQVAPLQVPHQQQLAPPPYVPTSSLYHHQPQPSHQQAQPQIPTMPFYNYQVEQALAVLSNPQVANSLFSLSHVFSLYLQGVLRPDQAHHHTQQAPNYYLHNAHHHLQHQPSHYHNHNHNHLHNAHHHHHHHHHGSTNGNPAAGQDDTMNESKPRGLTRAEIDSLTPYVQMHDDPRTCVICLSKFELKSKIRPLPCNHAFHAKCVDKWLRTNRTCPICRRDALKTYRAKLKRV